MQARCLRYGFPPHGGSATCYFANASAGLCPGDLPDDLPYVRSERSGSVARGLARLGLAGGCCRTDF